MRIFKKNSVLAISLYLAFFSHSVFASITLISGSYSLPNSGGGLPLFLLSANSQTWSFIPQKQIQLPPHASNASVVQASCIGALCFAGGNYYPGNQGDFRAYLLMSQNNGNTWTYIKNIKGTIQSHSTIVAMNCFDEACMAVGSQVESSKRFPPLLITTQDSGASWNSISSIAHQLPEYFSQTLLSVTCQNEFCVAVGAYSKTKEENYKGFPLILTSQDKGISWTFEQVTGIDDSDQSIIMQEVACSSLTCVAVGSGKTYPTILTGNKNTPWTQVKIQGLPTVMNDAALLSVAYSGAYWMASGHYSATGSAHDYSYSRPLLITSADGQNWTTVKNITGMPEDMEGDITAAYCNDSLCIGVGLGTEDAVHYNVFFLMSYDQGHTWLYSSKVVGVPKNQNPYIYSVKCQGTVCVAAGGYWDTNGRSQPVLLKSLDSGNSWNYIPNSQIKDMPKITSGGLRSIF